MKKKTRIKIDIRSLFLSGTNVRGIGRYTNFLKKIAHPEISFIPHQPSIDYYFLKFSKEAEKRLPKNRFTFKIFHSSQLATISLENLALSLTSNPSYLYHFPNIYLAPPILPRGKIILTLHDLIPLEYPEEHLKGGLFNKTIYLHNLKLYSQKATAILTVSYASKKHLLNHLKIPPEKIKVVYNSIEDIFFTPNPYRKPKPYILYVGGVDYRKNIPTIIKVFHRLKKAGLTQHLILVSADMLSQRNSETTKIWRLIRKLNLKNSVIIKSHLPDHQLLKLYQQAQLLLFPSLAEGFGYPLVEAMASGCPVVASKIDVFQEISQGTVLLAPPQDEEALSQEAKKIIQQPQLREKLSQEAKKKARKYSFAQFQKEMVKLYFQLLNQ